MEYSIAEITEKVLAGYRFKRGDDLQVFLQAPLEELQHGAGVLQKHFCGNHIDFCTIINGRSGRCGEDCKYCAQSACHHTDCEEYGFLPKEEILANARANQDAGANRFAIVTSGPTLRTISGLVKAESGSIQWNGEELLGKPIDKIISAGIAMSPEGRRVFADLTVLENLKLGAYLRKDKAEIEKDLKWVYELFPRLEERNWQSAGTLSGGEQQMLAVGRALMSRPKLMMLDEPSLGLAPLVVQDIFSIIREINRQGVTVLLIEQNANMALKIADLAYVLETGNITMSGTGAELLANEKIKEAYLGKHR